MIRYFIARGETRVLNDSTRSSLRGSFISLSDGVTHYELTGPEGGDLVVLIPGLTVPLFYWDALAAELHSHGLRTLAYSAYGRGYSDRPHTRYDAALFVRQVVELTGALGLTGPRHWVGASMGALIAMAVAQQDVANIRSLTLVGPAGLETRTPPPVRMAQFDRLAAFIGRRFGQRILGAHVAREVRSSEHTEVLSKMVTDAYGYQGSIYALFSTLQAFPLVNQHELFRQTGETSIPTFLMWGSGDEVTPVDKIAEARALLQAEEYVMFEDCGHMPPFELPVAVAERMVRFYSSLEGRERPGRARQ